MFRIITVLALLGLSATATADNSAGISLFRYHYELAKEGNTDSMYMLGSCFERGVGVKRDYEKALFWYRKAASKGNPIANRKISKMMKKLSELRQHRRNKIKKRETSVAHRNKIVPKPVAKPVPAPQPSIAKKTLPEPKPQKNTTAVPVTAEKTPVVRTPSNPPNVASEPVNATHRASASEEKTSSPAIASQTPTLPAPLSPAPPLRKFVSGATDGKPDSAKRSKNTMVPALSVKQATRAQPAATTRKQNVEDARRENKVSLTIEKPGSEPASQPASATKSAAGSEKKPGDQAETTENEFDANPCNGPSARFMSTCR